MAVTFESILQNTSAEIVKYFALICVFRVWRSKITGLVFFKTIMGPGFIKTAGVIYLLYSLLQTDKALKWIQKFA